MRSSISDGEIVRLYQSGERVSVIQGLSGISRAAVYDCLRRNGVNVNRRVVDKLQCRFCNEEFDRPKSHQRGNGGYCSVICFHASRSIAGEYSRIGGAITRVNASLGIVKEVVPRTLGKQARKAVVESGIELNQGEVVHHKNGDKSDNDIDNLQVFKNQSEHMKFHHTMNGKNKLMADFIKKQGKK